MNKSFYALLTCCLLAMAFPLLVVPLSWAQADGAKKTDTKPTTITGELKRDDPLDEKRKHPSKVHDFKMSKGQAVVIRLKSSDFDAFVIVQDSSKKELAFNDDDPDGPRTQNSKLVFIAPKDDTYRIIVTSDDNKVGKYELSIETATAEQVLAEKSRQLNEEGFQLHRAGNAKEAYGKLAEALEIDKRLYPPERFKDGHPELAISLSNMGSALMDLGEPARALAYFEDALAMRRQLYPPERFKDGHPELARSLNNMGAVLNSLAEPARALTYFEDALAMRRRLYPPERFEDGHALLAVSLHEMGGVLQLLGEPAKALTYQEQSLAMYRRLYPSERFKDGHPHLAISLISMGLVLVSLGEPAKALIPIEEALAMRRRLYPPERFTDGHADLANSLQNMGYVLNSLGEPAKALPYYEQALAMHRKLYPPERFADGHPDLATSLIYTGATLLSLGEPAKTLPFYEQALAMRRKLYPRERFADGHPDLANSLNNLGFLLHSLGELAKALTFYEQALAMRQKLYPPLRFADGHPDLANSLNNVAAVLDSLGEPANALPYVEQAVAMRRKLYPPQRFADGHTDLASSLNTTGSVLQSLGQLPKALTYYEQALAMRQKLYPPLRFADGHPELATSLNNMAVVLDSLGEPANALPYVEQAVAMRRKLYPPQRFADGHPHLASSINNMGALLESLGEPAKALPHYEEALAMYRKLFLPQRFADGHPDLATSLNNMGFVLGSLGEPAKALPFYEQALAMYHRLATREIAKASEAQALGYRNAQPRTRFGYLSVVATLAPAAASYDPLWHTRGDLLPLLQARHSGVVALLDQAPDVRKDYENLIAVRQKTSRLQHELPTDKKALQARDKELAALNDEQDRLERKLVFGLPEFKHIKELATKGPADLAKALPTDTAVVDLIRYHHREKGKFTGQRYVAFVLLKGQPPTFLQLGDATAIDAAATAWRQHIDANQESLAPAKLRELVWDKIAKELPASTKRIYLCPDGDLARVPFAALPGVKKGTILLEDYAIATVPSGPWLLGQLLYPPKASDVPDRILAIGGVDYSKPTDKYQALPGTDRELKRVLEAFGQPLTDGLAGAAASADAVRALLPKLRYAHFATHGYFDEKSLAEERKRQQEYLKNWAFQDELGQRAGIGVRNPAGFTGLVLAGANAPAKDGKDNGILTGLDIVDLPLEKLRLCVLSACETGLGELTDGEGILGLQRAFHAAGCPNVVGSLWRVDDEATAALMTQFYHELRASKRAPLDALRQAQLTVYYHPERISALAGSRGPVNQADTVKLGTQAPAAPGGTGKTTPTKLWAAFFLSGLGQ